MALTPWTETANELPPEHVEVETKNGEDTFTANLKRQGALWFKPDYSMYVYYKPTHWRLKP